MWEDEHDGRPIPNSIYNNDSGFTHDYLSGTVALATEPDRCLGIPPAAWAAGGPVNRVAATSGELASRPDTGGELASRPDTGGELAG